MAGISQAVREYIVTKDIKAIKFVTAALVPPPKKDVLAYLGIPTAPGQAPTPASIQLIRKGEIDVGS